MGPPSSPRSSSGPFDGLYKEHVQYVAALARRCVREADVNDLVQEVFIVFYRALLRGLDTTRSLRKWLRRTCVRKVRDHRKLLREREQPASECAVELADVADVAPTPEDVMIEISAWTNMDAVLDKLPREQRLVFVMSAMEEMSNREIAEDLEIPEGTVATRLAAARKAARRAWEERRASGLAAVAPFALWDFDSLVKHAAAPPPVDPELEAAVWRGLVQRIPELANGAAAASIPAPKVLTARQAALGFVLAAILGAVLALLLRPHDPPSDASARLGPPSTPGGSAVSPPAAPSDAPPPVAIVAPTSTASASASASAVPDFDASDRKLIAEARAAIAQEDYVGARAALLRVRGTRYAGDRAALLQDVAAHLAGLDGGR